MKLSREKPGAGLFKFSKDLILTEENTSRTNLVLLGIFHPSNGVEIKYLPQQSWKEINNGLTKIEASSRGQECVVIEDKNGSIERWALNLIIIMKWKINIFALQIFHKAPPKF